MARLREDHNIRKILCIKPEIVVLEAGTNDLTKEELTAADVCAEMVELVRDLLDCHVRQVIVGQIILRGEGSMENAVPDFDQKVYKYNHCIEDTLKYLPRASFWHHRKLWDVDIEAHLEDGTHPNELDNKKLYRSVKGKVLSYIWRFTKGTCFPYNSVFSVSNQVPPHF